MLYFEKRIKVFVLFLGVVNYIPMGQTQIVGSFSYEGDGRTEREIFVTVYERSERDKADYPESFLRTNPALGDWETLNPVDVMRFYHYLGFAKDDGDEIDEIVEILKTHGYAGPAENTVKITYVKVGSGNGNVTYRKLIGQYRAEDLIYSMELPTAEYEMEIQGLNASMVTPGCRKSIQKIVRARNNRVIEGKVDPRTIVKIEVLK